MSTTASCTGALNVDAATLVESVTAKVSDTGALNVDAATSAESVKTAASDACVLNIGAAKIESTTIDISLTGALKTEEATLMDSVAIALSEIVPATALLVKSQPVLFPLFTFPLLKKDCQAAPPVALDRLIEQNETDTVPLALDSVWLAAVAEPMVIKFPDVPDRENPDKNVFVVPAVNKTVAG